MFIRSQRLLAILSLLTTFALDFPTEVVFAVEGKSVLAIAVQNKQWDRLDGLIEQKIDVNVAQVDGMTALHWAVLHDNGGVVKKLIDSGADVNAQNRYGVSVLYLACLNGNGRIVEQLLQKGADAHHELTGGETLLMTAARTGKVTPVKRLLDKDVKVNEKDRKGQTAIMWAAAAGNKEVVELLIEAGADYRTPLKSGFTPLFFAIREGRTNVVLRLLEEGLDVNQPMQIERQSGKSPRNGMTPLMLAIENGHFELAAKLLELGADPNEKRTGYTPLHALTWVRKPVRGDGDPSPIGSGEMGSLDFVRELIKRGADVNARHGKHSAGNQRLNKTDATAFLLACETGDLPYLKLLLELDADPSLKNKDNTTPLLAAAGVGILSNGDESAGTEEEAIATVELLLKRGADVNAVDDRGHSGMHGAAYKSWTKLVQLLADHGADIEIWNQKNHFKRTPLEIAQGHRPGNFRPSAETIAAIERVMQAVAE
ncbi:MAG: ankyrin repeat domain-containing protein [Planctomycetaceae bacterium]|nr:ankyrin repeat domain-containing protein [Planctomycetaceae bacterium]MDB4786671.1 ankyrin repeat domain-containing protein [Planctomycetaceae bacterium]MDG2388157.1 ankyrin repeat domain-containing protein [Planctomycetaceae bacterium]